MARLRAFCHHAREGSAMYLLYLDESGNENDPNDRYFVLGGLALFERQIYFLAKALETVQEKHFPGHQPIPFHASEIRSGRNLWRKVSTTVRAQVLADLADEIVKTPPRGRALYAAAIEKSNILWGEDAVEKATEEICRRFDIRLQRLFQDQKDPQRGLLIFSEGRFDARAKLWVRGFHQRGTRWGAINNLADIPYFAPMHESRLLQAADYVSHAVWLLYERHDPSLIRPLLPCFDCRDGILHGLAHVRANPGVPCDCPACFCRRSPGHFGPWMATAEPPAPLDSTSP
jgi:hypothetical protein